MDLICPWLPHLKYTFRLSEDRWFWFCIISSAFAPGPPFRILDWTCYHRTTLYQIYVFNNHILHGSSRLCRSGVEVTKAPFVNFSVSKIFVLAKVPLRLFESHLYLTGATAAELQRHLSNINAIFNSVACVLMILKNSENKGSEEIGLVTPTPDCLCSVLVPWNTNMPVVCWSTFTKLVLNDSWIVILTEWSTQVSLFWIFFVLKCLHISQHLVI